jgi:hypothetical protein
MEARVFPSITNADADTSSTGALQAASLIKMKKPALILDIFEKIRAQVPVAQIRDYRMDCLFPACFPGQAKLIPDVGAGRCTRFTNLDQEVRSIVSAVLS